VTRRPFGFLVASILAGILVARFTGAPVAGAVVFLACVVLVVGFYLAVIVSIVADRFTERNALLTEQFRRQWGAEDAAKAVATPAGIPLNPPSVYIAGLGRGGVQ
jgi:hypothetical protein